MSTQTWDAGAHPRNLAGGVPGNRGAFITKQLGTNDQVVLAGDAAAWAAHTSAVSDTVKAMGVGSGETYAYRSADLQLNPAGQATAYLKLEDPEGPVQLEHNFATGITTLKRPDAAGNSDPEEVAAAVRDIYGSNRAPVDLFLRLRGEAYDASWLHPGMREAVDRDVRTEPDHAAHSAAVNDAAFEANIRSGHAYDYESAALLINPEGEPEAFINLNDGETTQLRHNYATGVTTYSCRARGIEGSTDPELIQVAAEDISPEHGGDPQKMFRSLRGRSLEQPTLHPGVRAPLNALS